MAHELGSDSRRIRPRRWSPSNLARLAVMSLLVASCGTRVPSDGLAEGPSEAQGAVHSTSGPSIGTGVPTGEASQSPVPAPEATSSGSAPQAAPSVRSGPSGNTALRRSPPEVQSSSASDGSPSSRHPGPPGKPGLAPSPPGGGGRGQEPATPINAVKTPVVLASVGTYSGPAGTVLAPMVQGGQFWVKHINSKGGLNGHAVRLLVYDDSGDSARHRAQVQKAIEQDHAIAFLVNGEAITGRSSIDYITAKRVPIVGTDTGEPWVYDSPMYFPQASSGDGAMYPMIGAAAQVAIPAGKTKLGSVVCIEGQTCLDAERTWSKSAQNLGFEYVSKSQASIAQPDFTAECLRARNAGVEVLLVGLDQNSVRRVSAACGRQAYRPIFVSAPVTIVDEWKDDPNLDNSLAAPNTFPYFQSGTPGTDEFQRAARLFGGGAAPQQQGLTVGWVAGKLLERAAANLPEPPTSEAILRGLWSIKDDALGGLTQPLTFVEDRPVTPISSCWFTIAIRGRAWVSVDGFKLHCAKLPA